VRSAFGHAGQKCSAASLGILTAGVYDDPRFRRQLADAVASLHVGPAADPVTEVPDLIRPPGDALRRALTDLDEGEEWLVAPRSLDDSDRRWTPGVRLGVRPGSFFHVTECFGPVLGLMRAPDLPTAVEWQNATAFGLTGGIHSLDVDELGYWCDTVEVGNAYVNRATTGAIVRRQPFGGWKASSVGPTAKAGGPNQLLSLGRWHPAAAHGGGPGPDVGRAARSFHEWWDLEFGRDHDPSGLRSEANVLRYLPLDSVVLRVGPGVTEAEVRVAEGAARVSGVPVEVSRAGEESDDEFAARAVAAAPTRVRVLGPLAASARRTLHGAGLTVDDNPVVDHGRIELLRWVHEQSVTVVLHRHGNVDDRFRTCVS
jgi:RHH-type transcriptional regulator, proline utilization regulon repressor / proline dehydrogenase / delta 1-pyrroline-5-carboxylate dehydrogenase